MADSLLARARAAGTPIVEGDRAIFVYEGADPPLLVGDFNGWDAYHPAHWEKAEANLWTYSLSLPADAYMEYAFLVEPGEEVRVHDPFNPRTVPNGIGQINHYFYMPEATPTSLAQRSLDVREGLVTRHLVQHPRWVAGGRRIVHLYHPPTDQACSLVIVFDGRDYLRRARLSIMVDNLVAAGRMQPIALALVENGGPARMLEYACNEATVGFLMECVLPLAQKHLNLVDPARRPGAHGVLGASMGGLMALYTALRLPQVFGHVLSQSGAFQLGSHDTVIFPLIRHAPRPPVRIWLDVGRYEWLLPANRQLRDLLAQGGYDFVYREFNAGHNYPAWRDDVWRGLEWLFPAQVASCVEIGHEQTTTR